MTEEDKIQVDILAALARLLPFGAVVWHIPNEGKRGWRAQKQIKDLGLKKGMPDLQILHDGKSLFIEVKKPGGPGRTKTYPSRDQKDCMAELESAGAFCAVARSVDEAIDFVGRHISLRGKLQ